MSRTKDEAGYVYCIGIAECLCSRVKIGSALDPKKRLDTLQLGSPCQLEIKWIWQVSCMDSAETELHHALALWRLHGEWFALPEKVIYSLGLELNNTEDSIPNAVARVMSLDYSIHFSGGLGKVTDELLASFWQHTLEQPEEVCGGDGTSRQRSDLHPAD